MKLFFLNRSFKKSLAVFVLLTSYLTTLTYLAVGKSFNLALSGDDWLMHWMTWSIFYVRKITSIYNPMAYLCTYCPHWPQLALMEHFWGYNPFYYYLISMISRVLVALALFYSLKYITKKRYLAFMAATFFAVGYLGIETTDWVFNFIHYLGLAIAVIFLALYFRAKEKPSVKNVLLAAFVYLLALIVSPPRMHGILPLIFILEAGWFLIEGKNYKFKQAIIRILLMIFVFRSLFVGLGDLTMFLRKYNIDIGGGHNVYGYGEQDWTFGRVVQGFDAAKTTLEEGRSDILLYPMITIGNDVLPDRLWKIIPFQKISFFGKYPFTFFTFIFPTILFLGFLGWLLFRIIDLNIKQYIYFYLALFFLLVTVYLFKRSNVSTFSSEYVAYALVGGYAVILSVFLFFVLRKKETLISLAIAIGMGWMVTPGIFPYLIDPLNILHSWGRYSIHQGVGLSIWFAAIFFIAMKYLQKKRKYLQLALVCLLVVAFAYMHSSFTNGYLTDVTKYRSLEIDKKYWSQITSEVSSLDKNVLSVFYLESDPQDALIAEWTLRFTFVGRSALYYQITNENLNPFMIVNNYGELFSTISDGKRLAQQGKPSDQLVSINNIYAFRLKNRELSNITDVIRERLSRDYHVYLNNK